MRGIRLWLATLLFLVLIGSRPAPARADEGIAPTDDAFVRDEDGQRDTNFDEHADQILVTAEGFPGGVPVNIGYLRFELSGLSGTLTSARLRLYNQASPGPSVTVAVYSTTEDDWNGAAPGLGDETTLTFNNAPAEAGLLDSQSGSSSPAWMEFSGSTLTAYVNDQLSGDEMVTLRVKVTSAGFADVNVFEDRENGGGTGHAPSLVLEGVTSTTVTLASFTATAGAGQILVEWETEREVDNAGFNLYRSQHPDGMGQGLYTQLNDALIPSQAVDPNVGAAYSYPDADVEPGVTYYYWLEDVSTAAETHLHGPVSATACHSLYLPLILRSHPGD